MGKQNKKDKRLQFQMEGLENIKVEPDCYYCAKPIDMRPGRARNGYIHPVCEPPASKGTSFYPNGPDSELHLVVDAEGHGELAAALTFDELQELVPSGDAPASQ